METTEFVILDEALPAGRQGKISFFQALRPFTSCLPQAGVQGDRTSLSDQRIKFSCKDHHEPHKKYAKHDQKGGQYESIRRPEFCRKY